MPRRWLFRGVWLIVLILCGLRFYSLNADFPNYSPWGIDQAKYTDEGWWASGAIAHQLLGHWNVSGDYNPAVAVPVWPLFLGILFRLTGVSIFAARSLSILLSLGSIGIVFLLVRRYSEPAKDRTAALAVLMLAASPFAFVFSRLAILDCAVVFEFCLLMLVASYAGQATMFAVVTMAVLVPVMFLTKTTAVLLVPAALWLMGKAMKGQIKGFAGAVLLIGAISIAALKTYFAIAVQRGYGPDLQYFFAVNQPEDIAWRQGPGVIAGILRDCRWIDPILYPLGLLLLMVAIVWQRQLWRNPLFTASWIAIACQAVFVFSRQPDYPPRYFLVMLVPLIISIAIAMGAIQARYKRSYFASLAVIAISIAMNTWNIASMLRHRTHQLSDAAMSIGSIIKADPNGNHLLLGVSGSEISLMTGLPSINDAYGTERLSDKVLRYHPGWLLVWDGIGEEDKAALSPFRVEKVSSYTVFDDKERNLLILYRVSPR